MSSDGGSRSTVRYELRDGVAWITIDRPEKRNALDATTRTALLEATRRFNEDDDAAVMVLTGAGDVAFCAGADLAEMAEADEVPAPDFIPQFGRTIEVPKPTIAAVNGVALAGGFLLAQCCDLIVAAEHAWFGITEARVGRGAPWAAPLPLLVPPRIAMQLLVTAEPIPAQRAYEVGLVNEVVAAEALESAAQRLARTIAANAPLSVRAGKRTVGLTAQLSLDEAYREAERLWDPVYRSLDAREGPRAFRDKRAPRWQGR